MSRAVSSTDATPQTVLRESQRLSAALTKAPLDASLHEQAALVTAAFALHEAAGDFSDSRRELCRVSAHLAIARALQPQATGAVRPLGEAALQTLCGRETSALKALAEIPADAAGSVSWVRALRMRNTGNWQAESDSTILLETLEVFRARARAANSHFAVTWIAKLKPAPVHDWRRVVLENGFGVEYGHRFAKESIGQEIASLQEDWAAYFGRELPDQEVPKVLNEPAARAVAKGSDGTPVIGVLGWDFWSAQHQRHLCQSIRASNEFFRDLWHVPEYRDVQKFAKSNFPDLALFPLLERELSEDTHDISAIGGRVSALIGSHPELVGPAPWSSSRERCGENMPALNVVSPAAWFDPLLPFGTTYGYGQRSSGFHLPGGKDQWWTNLLALAPSSYRIRYGQVWKTHGEQPPAEVAETAYATLLPFHLKALVQIARAQKDRSPKYPGTMQQVCEIDPDYYFELGRWYVAQKNPEKAAEAYQKGVDLGEDRIRAANGCGWLVTYLEDHGQPDRALAVATMAAEVYSHSGLSTMARLQERRGQLKEAEDYFEKIGERYEDTTELLAFYTRQRAKDPEYEKRAAAAEKKLFPNGIKKVTLADFQGVPEGGATFVAFNQYAAAAGLKKGDVLVAIDGYATGGRAQYLYVRDLGLNEDLKLIVWDGTTYREVVTNPPERRFDVELSDFKKK